MKKLKLLLILSLVTLAGCETLKEAGNRFMAGVMETHSVAGKNQPGQTSNAPQRAVQALRYGEPEPDYAHYDIAVAKAIVGDFISAKAEFSKIDRKNRLYNAAQGSKAVVEDGIADVNLKPVVVQYFKADQMQHVRQYKAAISELQKCIDLNPSYAKPYLQQGSLYALTGQIGKALETYNKVIKLDPNNSDAYYSRGYVYERNGDTVNAKQDYSKSIMLANNTDAYLSRSQIYIKEKKFQEATADANKIIEYDPSNPLAYNILGYINVSQNNRTQACMNYKKACDLGHCVGFTSKQQEGYC